MMTNTDLDSFDYMLCREQIQLLSSLDTWTFRQTPLRSNPSILVRYMTSFVTVDTWVVDTRVTKLLHVYSINIPYKYGPGIILLQLQEFNNQSVLNVYSLVANDSWLTNGFYCWRLLEGLPSRIQWILGWMPNPEHAYRNQRMNRPGNWKCNQDSGNLRSACAYSICFLLLGRAVRQSLRKLGLTKSSNARRLRSKSLKPCPPNWSN